MQLDGTQSAYAPQIQVHHFLVSMDGKHWSRIIGEIPYMHIHTWHLTLEWAHTTPKWFLLWRCWLVLPQHFLDSLLKARWLVAIPIAIGAGNRFTFRRSRFVAIPTAIDTGDRFVFRRSRNCRGIWITEGNSLTFLTSIVVYTTATLHYARGSIGYYSTWRSYITCSTSLSTWSSRKHRPWQRFYRVI